MTTALVMNDKPLNLGVTCNLGNIDNYVDTAMRFPMLTHEDELDLARRWRDEQDAAAAQKMIMSHLRLVTAMARTYAGYQLPYSDLVQEGNIGLLKAVQRFDPTQNVRMSSYAIPWIKAEMNEYVIRNCRIVRNSTTKPQRKLFYNLRSHLTSWKAMSVAEVESLAEKLNVKVEDVREMEIRLRGADYSIDVQPANNGEDGDFDDYTPSYLSTLETEPTQILANERMVKLHTTDLQEALDTLNDRQRDIMEQRYLTNDSGAAVTLQTLATKYGVSAERIRQIEVEGIKKLREALAESYEQAN